MTASLSYVADFQFINVFFIKSLKWLKGVCAIRFMSREQVPLITTHLNARTCRELLLLRPDKHLNNVIAIRSNWFLLHPRCTRQMNSLSDNTSIFLERITYGVPLIIYEYVLFAVCSKPFASAQFDSFSTFCKQLQ